MHLGRLPRESATRLNNAMTLSYSKASSLRADGSRNYVHPADVSGRFDRIRRVTFALLLVLLVSLPWIQVGGHPAVFLDVQHRRFFLFGLTFNAQDFWLVFFLLSGVGYGLFVLTAIWGRVWCGYACPQTVFLEALFRPVERLIEGPRNVRMKRDAGPNSVDRFLRKLAKHSIYWVLSFLIAHVIVSYFVSLPALYQMVIGAPEEHPEAFVWALSLTSGVYFVFSWFREQLCLIVCPYGRLQSVMTDRDTLVIGYDDSRGEPRGKVSDSAAGDCVGCNRCVVVCPTGIDIRNGLQIDCIGCARCVDACDDVMTKLKRPVGLVRYDSSRGFAGLPRRLWRSRVALYVVLGIAGVVAFSVAVMRTESFEANVLRLQGAPYTLVDGVVRNGFQIHIVNKGGESRSFSLVGQPSAGEDIMVAIPELSLSSLGAQHVPVFVSFELGSVEDGAKTHLVVSSPGLNPRVLPIPLAAPHK